MHTFLPDFVVTIQTFSGRMGGRWWRKAHSVSVTTWGVSPQSAISKSRIVDGARP
ncbi:MAG TPA: hypothetical protein VNN13_07645 [Methylomirabilota bacterium]|nr:hypothetical protein [Methylomirabilota bacterium]